VALALALVLAGIPAAPAAGQGAGSAVLRGQVRDSTGAGLAGVDVVLRDTAETVLAATVTDGQGRYILVGLPPGGPYTLEATQIGYAAARRDRIRLASGESRRLDLVLRPEAVTLPGLVVSAPDLVFSGTRTGAATVIEERAITATPTVERSVVSLAALSPMVSVIDDRVSVAGQNSRFNSLRVDGAVSQDLFGLSPSGVPGGRANARPLPLAAVRQYSVVVAPYDVRQSGFTGAVLNATTRRGGSRWEASGFGYYRGDAFSRVADDSDVIRAYGRGPIEEFSTRAGGFTVGGPLGSARLFVAGELEERSRPMAGFHLGSADPYRVGLVPDSVDRLTSLLEGYGLAPGTGEPYALENPLGNLFARLDAPLGGAELSLRYNLITAERDVAPNRLGFDEYGLTSAGTRIESRTHGAVGRVTARLGPRTTSELSLNVQRTDERTRSSRQPTVEVLVPGEVQDTLPLGRYVRAGSDPLAHDDRLEQTLVQVTEHISHAVGDHLFSVGADAAWFGVRRRYLPVSRGVWRFGGLDLLATGSPDSYERLVPAEGVPPEVDFSLLQLAAFAQDEWSLGDELSLTLGVRVDWPVTLSRPGYNRAAEITTGVVTDRLPSANPLVAPRVGLNWSPSGERWTQVRGGIGIFTGMPPLAWIADAYANTGLRTGFLRCTGTLTPAFQLDEPPAACADGSGPDRRDLVVFDEDFRYPQDLRASLAVDRELPGGFVATVEALYTRALAQVAMEDLNLPAAGDPQPGPEHGYTFPIGTRPVFGVPLLLPTRFGPLQPRRRWGDYGRVLRVGNRSRNAALTVAAELQRRFSDRLDLRAAYSYTRAVDVRSLLYRDAELNYGNTPVGGDPARPETSLSAFDRTHRVIGSVWARLLEWGGGLDLTLTWVGQSGTPYSYVYGTDMNGDGYPGPGAAETAYNDLLYVPAGLSDAGGSGIITRSLVFQLAALEPCLEERQGAIAQRNSCRTPWSDRVDLSLSQGIRLPFGHGRLRADLMNVLNLIDDGWGLVYTAPPVVPVLTVDRRGGCPGLGCGFGNDLVGRYTGPRRLDPATGKIYAEKPHVLVVPESQWRAQLGVELVIH
jgi:hypothetical protein